MCFAYIYDEKKGETRVFKGNMLDNVAKRKIIIKPNGHIFNLLIKLFLFHITRTFIFDKGRKMKFKGRCLFIWIG